MAKPAKNTICLWYDRNAEDAARFYAKTFPDSSVGEVHRAPGDFPSGKRGDVLTVEFTVMGVPCLGLNGGPAFKHNEAFSFQVATTRGVRTPGSGYYLPSSVERSRARTRDEIISRCSRTSGRGADVPVQVRSC